MSEPRLRLQLDDRPRAYQPGDVLTGRFAVEGFPPGDVRAIEVSVLWQTEGKGEEDLSIHYFERIEPQDGAPIDLHQPRRFSTMLPNSPLSYDGLIVKVSWRVRVRVFVLRGRELTDEVMFQLGNVPQPHEVAL
jgi:hypothetical protein